MGNAQTGGKQRFTWRLFAAGAFVTALILELGLRLAGAAPVVFDSLALLSRYDETLGWTLAPGWQGRVDSPELSVPVAINDQGLRDPVRVAGPADGARLIVLGDDVVWGWGVRQTERLTGRLAGAVPGTDIVSMAVPGYSLGQKTLLYERLAPALPADWVILVFSRDDLWEDLDGNGRPRFTLRKGELHLAATPVPSSANRWSNWLMMQSRLFDWTLYAAQMLRVRWSGSERTGQENQDVEWAGLIRTRRVDAWRISLALLDRLHRSVTINGARLLIVTKERSADLPELERRATTRGIPLISGGEYLGAAVALRWRTRDERGLHLSALGHEVLSHAVFEGLVRFGVVEVGN